MNAHCFNSSGIRQDERLNGQWLDCLEEEEEPVDEDADQHGTAMTTLLLRLLPTAQIYVARVSRDADGLSNAKENIAKVTFPSHADISFKLLTFDRQFSTHVSRGMLT